MNKLFTKIAALSVGLAMAIGVGVAVGSNKVANVKADTIGSWTQITAVSGLSVGDKIVIVTKYNNTNYFLGTTTTSSGHFQSLTFSSSITDTSNGVITLETTGTANRYKLASRGSTGYITASKASSGGGQFSDSDSSGWNFSINQDSWDIIYNSNSAYLRAYQNSFRTYGSRTNNACLIYKYSGTTPTPTAKATTTTITATGGATSINLGGTLQLSAAVTLTSGGTAVPGASVTYSSSNVDVATVNSTSGLVTASSNNTGNVTITASYAGVTGEYVASSGTYQIDVVDPNAVTFTAGTDTGDTTVTKSGITVTMTTMNNSGYYQIYANNTGSIVSTVGKFKSIQFTCTASGTSNYGPSKISNSDYTYSGYIGTWAGAPTDSLIITVSAQVRITKIVITLSTDPSISFATASKDLLIGEEYTQTAVTANIGSNTVSYTSGTEAIATVNSSSGKVTAVAEGESTITASVTVGSTTYTATYLINVTSPSVSFSNVKNVVFVGQTETTTANGVTGGATISYSSATTSVATVNSSGTVTGVAEGTSVITASATVHGKVYSDSYTMTVRGVNTPYSVAEAKTAVDSGFGKTAVYVTGIVSQVDSINDGAITYWISDDGTTTNQFEVYRGKNLDGANFSDISDVQVGDIVKVKGNITLYGQSTYEFSSSSQRVSYSRISITSIAVKTAPTKLQYKSGDDFDPIGLVITVTYSDSNTEDVEYEGHESSFSFDKEKITESCNVTITYRGQTCTQAVSLVTVTNVTGIASAPTEVYQGATISASEVTLNVTYSDSTPGTVPADSVVCDTTATGTVQATATYNAATGTKTASWNVEVLRVPSYDYVVDELVVGDTGISGTTYGNWSGVTKTSGAVYAGSTNENSNGGIGMRQDGSKDPSGIIVTSTPGVATKVQVTWTTTTSRTIHIKGQDTPYTSVEYGSDFTGTEVGTITYSSTSVDLSTEYKYICIYVTGGAVGLGSIKITWKIESASDPLTADPILSTGDEATVYVGKNIALGITTTPVDSDEKLIVTSSNTDYVTVSGSGRNYVIRGVAEGSATVTVAGAKGNYESSVLVTVELAQKSYEDKIMTPDDLGISSYETSDTTHIYEGVDFIAKQVMKSGGFQFKKNEGYLYNNESLYASNNIKAITLIMRASNTNEPMVYEGSEAGAKTTQLSSKDTFVAGGVNTYIFSGSTQFFRIDANADGAVNIEKIIIELEDSSSSILTKARSAALAILNGLSGLCGEGGSGVVTETQWNAINSALTALNLSNDDKLFLKNADRISLDNLAQGGALIENAMAHYDACVSKFGYTPFGGITDVKATAKTIPSLNIVQNNNSVAVILIVSVVGIVAIGGYFFLRKRRKED